jgi:hypothetical protein
VERWFPTKTETRKLLIILWEISRFAAQELLVKKHKRLLYAREFNKFQKVADELMMRWSQELAQEFFNKTLVC